MSIEVSENTLAVWLVNLEGGNLIAALNKVGDMLHLDYRFRDYVDDKTWGSKDPKRFYHTELPYSEKQIARVVDIMRTGKIVCYDIKDFHEVLREGKSFKEFSAAFMMLPGMHPSTMPSTGTVQ